MTGEPPLALRSGQTDWETEMFVHALIALIIDGEPPPVPLLVTDEDWQQLRQGTTTEG